MTPSPLFRFAVFLTVACAPLLPPPSAAAEPATEQPATANPYTRRQVQNKTNTLINQKDYAGLEAWAAELQKQRGSLYSLDYPLAIFYRTLQIDAKAKEPVWETRRGLLENWLAAYPESVAARTALMDWAINYAWKARGTGWSREVSEEGRKGFKERLAEAKTHFDTVMAQGNGENVYFYRIAMALGLGQGWELDRITACLDLGREIDPNYQLLYDGVAMYLAPKWYGAPGDIERFAANVASRFEGEESDFIFSLLTAFAVEHSSREATEFYERNPDIYERLKRGFEIGIRNAPEEWMKALYASDLMRFAVFKGDYATARPLFLEWGAACREHLLGEREGYLNLRRQSGAQAEIDKALQLEKEGKLEEAEALYRSFSTREKQARWLYHFYYRQGMKEKFLAVGGRPLPDIRKIPFNELHVTISRAAILGEWPTAKEGAARFNEKRPWNLTGLGVLFLCAAQEGDPAAGEALRASLLENKTSRPALQNARAILSGEKTWRETASAFHEEDGFNQQAAIVVIGWYLSQGDRKQAAEVLEAMTPPGGFKLEASNSELLNCMRYGSLRRLFENRSAAGEG